eukprot:scaffold255632_cov21-Tisochrysis_lutea.AAC.1
MGGGRPNGSRDKQPAAECCWWVMVVGRVSHAARDLPREAARGHLARIPRELRSCATSVVGGVETV